MSEPIYDSMLIQRTAEREAAYAEIRRLQDVVTTLREVEKQLEAYKNAIRNAVICLSAVVS